MTDFKTLLGEKPKIFLRLASVSARGRLRTFDCYVIVDNNYGRDILNVNQQVSSYTSKRLNKQGSVIVKGCGMGMAFALVRNLSMMVYGDDRLDYSVL